MDDCRAGWRFRKEIGPAVAGAANTNGGNSGDDEDVADEPLIVRAGANCREITPFFEERGNLLVRQVKARLGGGADFRERRMIFAEVLRGEEAV